MTKLDGDDDDYDDDDDDDDDDLIKELHIFFFKSKSVYIVLF